MKKADLEQLPLLYEKKNPQDGDFSDLFELLLGIDRRAGSGRDRLRLRQRRHPGDDQLHRAEDDHARQRPHAEELLPVPGHGRNRSLVRCTRWDLDLTFGKNFDGETVFDDVIWADEDHIAGYPSLHLAQPPAVRNVGPHRKIDSLWNRGIDRRARDRADPDDVLPPAAHADGRDARRDRYETRMAELQPKIAPEAAADALQSRGARAETPQTSP